MAGQISATLMVKGENRLELQLPAGGWPHRSAPPLPLAPHPQGAGDLLDNIQRMKAGSVEVLNQELGVSRAQAGAHPARWVTRRPRGS